jgi:penicillin amidase
VLFLACLIATPGYTIQRNQYGVPKVSATSVIAAYEGEGYATGQDRLWQCEMGRHLAEGRLSEVIGAQGTASDKDTLTLGYAPAEIDAEIGLLSPRSRAALEAYARGLNRAIDEAKSTHTLPPGYAAAGFEPAPWTIHDSAAIAIYSLKEFGRGGAGEIRDLALLKYVQSQPKLSGKSLDVMDDIAWLQDPTSPTTIAPQDDPVKVHPAFPMPTHAETEAQLAALPKTSIFDLLGGVRIAERKVSRAMASKLSATFYTGSYCIVVSPKRSATKAPLLLSGPQMGHTVPAVIHEVALRAPGLDVTGMDDPGSPGVVIGATPTYAWGLTSGVADVEDIFTFKTQGHDAYIYNGKVLPFTQVTMTINVKGGKPITMVQRRTIYGPVVIQTATGVFALRQAFRGHELQTYNSFLELPYQKAPAALDALIGKAPMSFNFFYAFGSGTIGYRYSGHVPLRNPHLDPRLPTPATPANDWRGFIPVAQMPHVQNPSSGLIVNWNNKPVSWWANGDTPVWGEIFHNSEILRSLYGSKSLPVEAVSRKLAPEDLTDTVAYIAKADPNWLYFRPYLDSAGVSWSSSFNGQLTDGSADAGKWLAFFPALRKEIFYSTTGSILSAQYFDLILQPTVMLHALQGKTKVDYLAGRTPVEVTAATAQKTADAGPYRDAGFPVPGESPVLYGNRGSYIQVLVWQKGGWFMRTIIPPGESESGPHMVDQAPLARKFEYKKSWQPGH